jgi:exodeoxyribonuclease VII small subunit
MSDDRTGSDVAELSFSEAMEELESVHRRIEGDEIDVDQLGRELGRAAQLLEVCRKKIRRAEVEVRQIVEQIEEDGTDSGAATPEAPEAESPSMEPASPDDQDDIPF